MKFPRRRRWWWMGLVVLLLVGGAAGFYLKSRGAKGDLPQEKRIQVTRKTLTKIVYLTGVVQPLRSVSVFSPVTGEITDMPASEGARVEKQGLLFRVDPDRAARQELENAEAAVERARLEVQNKEQALARQEKVEAYVATATLEGLRGELTAAKMASEDAVRKLTTIRETLGLSRTRNQSRLVQVFSPITGTVTFVHKTVGAAVFDSVGRAADPVMVVSDLSQVIVRTAVLENDVGLVRPNLPVTIRLRAFPGKDYAGKVQRVSPQGTRNNESATFEMDVAVTNPDASFRANLSAALEVQVDSRPNALSLPRNAVATFRNHSVVQLLGDKGYRAVETGLSTDTDIEIVGSVLAEKEEVAEMDFEKLDLEKLGSGELGKTPPPTPTPSPSPQK